MRSTRTVVDGFSLLPYAVSEDDDWATVHLNCLELVADYVDESLSYVVGTRRMSTIVRSMSEAGWDTAIVGSVASCASSATR